MVYLRLECSRRGEFLGVAPTVPQEVSSGVALDLLGSPHQFGAIMGGQDARGTCRPAQARLQAVTFSQYPLLAQSGFRDKERPDGRPPTTAWCSGEQTPARSRAVHAAMDRQPGGADAALGGHAGGGPFR